MKENRMQRYYLNAVIVFVCLSASRVYLCKGTQLQVHNLKDNRTLQIPKLAHGTDVVGQHRAPRQSEAAACRGTFRGSSINITSPGFPESIDDNALCQWLVIANEERATLSFHFSTSENKDRLCPTKANGWIFRDGKDPRGARLYPDCQQPFPKVRGISSVISIIFNPHLWVSERAFSVVLNRKVSTTTESVLLLTTSEALAVPPAQRYGRSDVGNGHVVDGGVGEDNLEEEVTDDNSGFLQCFFQKTSSSGIISSPEYPQKVEGPICTWIITAFSSEVIQLTFTDIDIDGRTTPDGDCDEKYSHLKVTTFDQSFNKLEDYYCRPESGGLIVHNSHENLWLEFRSNFGFSRFSSHYTSTDENTVTTDNILEAQPEVTGVEFGPECNLVLHDPTGVIQTPNFPDSYIPNLFCVWTVLTLPDRLIRLQFNEFDIDGPITGVGKCDINMAHKYSFVRISYYSVNGSLIDETFCGPDNPDVLISNANRLSIYFQSGHGIGKGFQASYAAISRQQLRGFGRSFGEFDFDTDCIIFMNETAGNITYNLHREKIEGTCLWTIQPSDMSAIIVLTIESLLFRSISHETDCERSPPPVEIEGLNHVNGEQVTWPLCDNVTDALPVYISHGQLNVTLNVTLWEIIIFDANYNLREESDMSIDKLSTPQTRPEKYATLSTKMMVLLDESKGGPETQEAPSFTTWLAFEEMSCDNVTSNATDGWINVQGLPLQPNSVCAWTLVSPFESWLWISFLEFNLDTLGNTACDPWTNVGSVLSILQTNDTFSDTRVTKPTRYGTFCGSVNPGLLFLHAKEVRLVLTDVDSRYRDLKLFYSWEMLKPTESISSLVIDEYVTTDMEELTTAFDYQVDGDVLETKPSIIETSLPTSSKHDDDLSVPSTLSTTEPTIYQIRGQSTTFYTPTEEDHSRSSASTIGEEGSTGTSLSRMTSKDGPQSSYIVENVEMSSARIEDQRNTISTSLVVTSAVIKTEIITEIIDEEEYVTPGKSEVISSRSPYSTHDENVDPSCEYRLKGNIGFGQIVSPDYPSSAPPSSKCMYIIQFERETKLKILFTEIELSHEPGKDCEEQLSRFRITTWSDQNLELKRLYFCGEFYPKSIPLQGKTIVIQFWSSPTDGESNRFRLEYFTKRFYRGLFDGFDNSSVTPTVHLTTPQQPTTKRRPGIISEVSESVYGGRGTSPSVSYSSPPLGVTDKRALPESDSRFRLTVFVCTGVALVLLTILLVLLILCVRNRNRSSALTLEPEFAVPGDYWSNYRQWASTDYPASVKPYYDAGLPSTSMHPGHIRPVEQERLV